MNQNILQKFLCAYFTRFPNSLYQSALNNGNMALAGVGLGLIRCQIVFWIINIISIINSFIMFRYNISNVLMYGLYGIYLFNIYILYNVVLKTNYLIKLI
jgi:hypothetical protein